MPSEKSARVSERKRQRNRSHRTATRTAVAQARETIGGGEIPAAEEKVVQAIRALDKAAHKKLIHPNNAARKKARLMARLGALKTEKGSSST